MSRRFILISFPVILLAGIYFMGPEPDQPVWNGDPVSVPQDADDLEAYVAAQEAQHKIKPDNEARIVWADSTRTKTEFSVVYIHGFSASQEEGDPVHEAFAKAFGCNLYLARMADHGVDTTDQLLYFNADRWWRSAREALAIGKQLGDKVIVMSTSTGGTISLILAATYPDDVYALINMSPNIAINDPAAWVLNKPWGLQLARLVKGGKYNVSDDPASEPFWNNTYRLEAATELQEMVDDKMNAETFAAVRCPVLNLYYYKNEQEQDPVVKVSAILEMHKRLGTPEDMKVEVAIPNAATHRIGSRISSKDVDAVISAAKAFAVSKLGMREVGGN